jgi:hypothetical protein
MARTVTKGTTASSCTVQFTDEAGMASKTDRALPPHRAKEGDDENIGDAHDRAHQEVVERPDGELGPLEAQVKDVIQDLAVVLLPGINTEITDRQRHSMVGCIDHAAGLASGEIATLRASHVPSDTPLPGALLGSQKATSLHACRLISTVGQKKYLKVHVCELLVTCGPLGNLVL